MDDVLVFLLAAVLVVSIFKYFKASSIIGYLIAGLAIGPYALGFISDIERTKALGHMGVVFLLFSIGLKLPMRRLQMMRRYVFGLGALQVLATTVFFSLISYSMGQTIEASILIGSALALSSTAVSLGVLSERGELAARFGRATFSVLLFQDLAVVVLLVMLTTLGQKGVSITHELGTAAFKAGIVLTIIVLVGRLILRPVYRMIASLENQDLFMAMTLLVILATSMLTKTAGLSMELGAFLAGLLLAETEYRHQVEADISPFHGLLLGLFFMTVGMTIDLHLLMDQGFLIMGLLLGFLTMKFVISALLCSAFKMPVNAAVRTSLLLAGGGEFLFVIFAPAVQAGLIPEMVSQVLFVAVAISMGLTPLLDLLGRKIDDHFTETEAKATITQTMSEVGDLKDHVIIAGFGRVGRMLATILAERMIPFVVIDKNMKRVSAGRAKGWPVFYGDARRPHVMRALGAEKSRIIVVSLNHTVVSMKTALMARRNFKNAEVCARMRDDEFEATLKQAGVHVIMPENLEPSLQLASNVLTINGFSPDEVYKTINHFRNFFKRSRPTNDDHDSTKPAMG